MKITYRVPTNEPFAFIEVERTPINIALTPSAIVDEYNSLRDAFKPEKSGDGLPKKEYDECIDKVMMGKTIHVSQYERMSPEEQAGYQLIKRSQARIKRLVAKEEIINQMGVENMSAMGE